MDRRAFLKISTYATGGMLITWPLPGCSDEMNQVRLYDCLLIGEDNSIKIILSKVEMRQGMWTTLPMLIAEELDCDWDKIIVEHSPPGGKNDFSKPPVLKSTGGSESTTSEFDHYRLAGATARSLLVSVATARLGVSPGDCKTEKGYVISGNKKLSYGQLAAEASRLPVPEVKLREPRDWKLIGRSSALRTAARAMVEAVLHAITTSRG